MNLHDYKQALAELPCMVSSRKPVQFHHVVGGSIVARMGVRGQQKHSDWLIIPLHYDYHQGHSGIHTLGVVTWEKLYGPQTEMIDWLCRRFSLDLWELAKQKERRIVRTTRPDKIIARTVSF